MAFRVGARTPLDRGVADAVIATRAEGKPLEPGWVISGATWRTAVTRSRPR